MTPAERIADLEAVVRQQREDIERLLSVNVDLQARVQELAARLAKDSHNSGKPPSSDGLARKPKRLRKKSGRKPGGQIGHRGETLRLAATPDEIIEHRPAVCSACQLPLDALQSRVVLRERRQVQEVPPLRLRITEHQALHVDCPACHGVSVGTFPPEAPSRAQYGPRLRALCVYLVEQQLVPYARVRSLLVDLFGATLSRGTLVQWVQQAAQALALVEAQVKQALARVPVLHSDETGVRRAGTLAWAHVASTPRLTHYAVHAKRGSQATEAIGILPAFTGGSMHDGWAGYRALTGCRHALCNIHHLRELTFLEEQYHQAWAKDFKELLLQMKVSVKQARAAGRQHLPPAARSAFVTRYEAVLVAGHAANPPPARRPRQRGASSRRRRKTAWNAGGWVKSRCSPSSATCASPLTTIRRSATCACSRCSTRSRARSAQQLAPRRSAACAAICPRSTNRASNCLPRSKPSSPGNRSIRASSELLRRQ
jgi:transposase